MSREEERNGRRTSEGRDWTREENKFRNYAKHSHQETNLDLRITGMIKASVFLKSSLNYVMFNERVNLIYRDPNLVTTMIDECEIFTIQFADHLSLKE